MMSDDQVRMGRPQASGDPRPRGESPYLNFTIPPEDLPRLKTAAEQAGMSRAGWMRQALTQGIEAGQAVSEDPRRAAATRVVAVRVPPRMLDQLQTLADRSGLSRAATARAMILRALPTQDPK